MSAPSLPHQIISSLRSLHQPLPLATAESCTGGLIANELTDIPGSSEVFRIGVVAYSEEAKEGVLGVARETIREKGVVSEEVAVEMAKGARLQALKTLSDSTPNLAYGISTTGELGLGSQQDTAWLAIVGPEESRIRTKLLKGDQIRWDRKTNKLVTAYEALELLREQIEGWKKDSD
ncbi:CinA-domain-containing protein [Saitoella complicata NRRL Y-17804]|nr:CinA-domain-containing protein [Saitoella complicata NRRL Y-17804]ODQ52196.1 CinA-domain-containing protein [Saitoella complicata NRRL Y-17804]